MSGVTHLVTTAESSNSEDIKHTHSIAHTGIPTGP